MSEKVNSFFIDNENVVFFNIFIKNNKLYIITPLYKNYNINKNTINVSYNSKDLYCLEQIRKLPRKVKPTRYENTQILIYDFNFNSKKIYEIKVSFKNKNKIFNLPHIKTTKNKKLTITTLFKDDYKLNEIFYDYYKKQGVEHFYMYYNGKITDEIKKYYCKDDITLIEWDYLYWNDNSLESRHHAQLGQIHDAIYRFGKDNCEYMIFCDLDEYLFDMNKNRLVDIVKKHPNANAIIFKNLWANAIDYDIPNKFPDKFYVSDELLEFPRRSKCIHKMDTVKPIYIHNPDWHIDKKIVKDNYIMFHFHSWGGESTSLEKTNKLISIEEL